MDLIFDIDIYGNKILITGGICYPCCSSNFGKICPSKHSIGSGDVSPLFGTFRSLSVSTPPPECDESLHFRVSETDSSCLIAFDKSSSKPPVWFVLKDRVENLTEFILIRVSLPHVWFYPISTLEDIDLFAIHDLDHSYLSLTRDAKNKFRYYDHTVHSVGVYQRTLSLIKTDRETTPIDLSPSSTKSL